jgi:trimeric autotransporter adhesin
VNFTGYTGANLTTVFPNWYEANGAAVPTLSATAWTSQTGLAAVGNITARINLFNNLKNEWIVGPKFTAAANSAVTFDAAVTNFGSTTVGDIMGSDDNVRVMVSTDCGVSYTPVFTISATNSLSINLTNFSVPLGTYAGQDIIVGFLASEGTVNDAEDYDFHLDNINILNVPLQDAGVSALTSPPTIGCYGASENLVVTINNYGSSPITNVPVTVIVSGAATQTSNATFTGTIAPSSSASFTVATLNMTAFGTYSFNAFTSLAGDGNSANDNMAVATRTNGFTGANLTTVFPNWYEANGASVPTPSSTAWINQTGVNSAGNITARINLFSNTKNEWIVGPKFTASANSTQLLPTGTVSQLLI